MEGKFWFGPEAMQVINKVMHEQVNSSLASLLLATYNTQE
jgi:hypothetical protein